MECYAHLCGVMLTLAFSIGSNGLEVTAFKVRIRIYCLFCAAYLFRGLLAVILQPSSSFSRDSAAEASEQKVTALISLRRMRQMN